MMTHKKQRSIAKFAVPTTVPLLALMVYAAQGLALGVDEADVRSPLNAPLRATLPLNDADGIQPGLLNVSVADERAFRELGLERTALAASISLEVEQRDGQTVVNLATERPVREPWLDLLLRFDWPGGQQMREVTLLFDPPDYANLPALASGGAAGASAAPASAASAPVSSAPTSAAMSAPRDEPSAPSSPEPARVRSGDTLWGVALRLRPDDAITPHQMMVALLEANPNAFRHGNINAVRAGASLSVPDKETITARSHAAAASLVAQMNQAWAQRNGGVPAEVPLREEVVSARSADLSEAPPRALEVAASAAPLRTSNGAERESASPERSESRQTEPEPTEPEQAAPEPEPSAAPAVSDSVSRDDVAEWEARLAEVEQQWRESRDALDVAQAERDELRAALTQLQEEMAALQTQLSALDDRGAEAMQPGASATPSARQQMLPSWWPTALGGAALAALAGAWLLLRRRRSTADVAMAQTLSGDASAATALTPHAPHTQLQEPATEPPAAKAFGRETLPQAETISEVDIFLAYGRYDQARDLLEASLARNPERHDMRLKLVSVYLAQGERAAAEREAQHLRDSDDPAVRDELERLLADGQRSPTSAGHDAAGDDHEEVGREYEADGHESEELEYDSAGAYEMSANREEKRTDEMRTDEMRKDDRRVDAASAGEAPASEEQATAQTPSRGGDLPEIIDYQPPALDPEPAPREETPMQPSIDFTTDSPGSRPDAGDDEWEVEEVSFPSINLSDGSSTAYSHNAREQLEEARRLVEAGDRESARELLGKLSLDEDTTISGEAAALLKRC